MSYNSRHTVGAMHPMLFCMLVSGIVLFLAFFICTTLYNNWRSPSEPQLAAKQTNSHLLADAGSPAAFH